MATVRILVRHDGSGWRIASPEHELDRTLKSMGFLPINPPSTLLGIGSLFYVDPQVKFFRTVCPA